MVQKTHNLQFSERSQRVDLVFEGLLDFLYCNNVCLIFRLLLNLFILSAYYDSICARTYGRDDFVTLGEGKLGSEDFPLDFIWVGCCVCLLHLILTFLIFDHHSLYVLV